MHERNRIINETQHTVNENVKLAALIVRSLKMS